MKSNVSPGFRRRLLAVAACPLGVALVAALACPESLLVVLGAGLAFAVVAGLLTWTLSRPLGELAAALEDAVSEENAEGLPVSRRDELGAIATAVAELIERLADTRENLATANVLQADTVKKFTTSLETLTGAVGRVATATQATPVTLELPAGVSGEPINAALTDLTAKVLAARQRLAALTRILQACPLPLVATDDRGNIRLANPAAEQILGRQVAQLVKSPLGNFLRPVTEADPTGIPSLVLTGVADWLSQGGRQVVAETAQRGVRVALVSSRSVVSNHGMWCIAARELADDHRRLGVDRAQTREEVLRSMLLLTERQTGITGELITAQARQLICDAKQTPQRDTLVPRLKTIRDAACQLDGQARLARWLTVSLWGELPTPAPVEFLAGESVRSVIDLLSVRLKEADLTVNVNDAGGWLFCDEEWFATAVLGVLTHTAAATRGGPVGVRLRRLPCLAGKREGNIEVEVVDAGPPLTPEQSLALTSPLGGLTPSALLPVEDNSGFIPGLLVAKRLVNSLGGELAFDATPSGRLVIRLMVPTRLPSQTDLPTATRENCGEPAATEELCLGWRLGLSS